MVTRAEFDALTKRVRRLEGGKACRCPEEVDDLVEHDDCMGRGVIDGFDDAGEEVFPDGTNP